MGTYNDSFFKAFEATAVAIPRGTRVQYDANGKISAAAATSTAAKSIGVAWEDIPASGLGTVRLWAPTTIVLAGAAVARGAALYHLANGKVDDAVVGGENMELVALEAATADGDEIEAAAIR